MCKPLGTIVMPNFYWQKSIPLTNTLLPIVTCIMPTADRLQLMLTSIQYFLDQDYPYKELVIIDDSKNSAARLIPTLYSIRYFHLHPRANIGAKRNVACEKAAGSIIVHWDDDDWYAPNWVSYQVNTLLNSEADICGLNRIQCYSMNTDHKYWTIENQDAKKLWLSAATLAYLKSFWKKNRFNDVQIGEEEHFISNAAKIFAHDYYKGFIATIHSTNVRIREY